MTNFSRRVNKLEKKMFGSAGEGRIARWAIDLAQDEAKWEQRNYDSWLPFQDALRKIGKDVKDHKPPEPKTEKDILQHAKELSKKYTSLEDYKENRPRDFSALDKILKKVKADMKQRELAEKHPKTFKRG